MGRRVKNTTFEQREFVFYNLERILNYKEISKLESINESTAWRHSDTVKNENRIKFIQQKGAVEIINFTWRKLYLEENKRES